MSSGLSRWITNIIILSFVFSFAYLGQATIKYGLNRVGEFKLQDPKGIIAFFQACAGNRYFWAGGFCVGIGFLMWVAFLSRMELSQALPMLAFSYVPWLVIGHYVFHDNVNTLRIVGVILITVGVFCVGYSGKKTTQPAPAARFSMKNIHESHIR